MIRLLLLLIFSLTLFGTSISWADADKIGSLRKVSGETFVQRAGETQTIKAVDGLAIYQNDFISTGSDGSVGIIFKDATRISLGPNSKLTVSKYVFNPSQKKFSMLTKMMSGTASFISGKISKLAPDSVSIETPDATIGSRGTSFLIKVEQR
ncbi:MAG: FecR domain-containing protein [Pseudomonadota bacterium]